MNSGKRESVKFDDEIFLRGETYYYRGTPLGSKKQIERSLKISKGAAQKDILKAKKELVDSLGNIGTRAGSNSFSTLARKYVKNREEEAKNPEILSTKTAYEARFVMENHAIPFFGNKRVDELEQIDFSDYCDLKRKSKLNLVNHRKVINHFMKWCVHESIIKYRVEFQIPKRAQKPRRERVVLTLKEAEVLIKATFTLVKIDPLWWKIRLYIMFYALMGMRNMEICKLRWDEVDFEKKALRINKWSNRRRKERAIPINSLVLVILREEYEKRTSEWVFPSAFKSAKKPYMDPSGSYRKGWFKVLEIAKLEKHITPHDLRAFFETMMHTNRNLTDTQRENMAGASIDVQKKIYVLMNVDHLRGAEESVQLPGIEKIIRANTREKRSKKESAKLSTTRKKERKSK